MTAGVQPYSRDRPIHAATAAPHAAGSPIGSAEARLTPATTRYVMAARPSGE